MAQSPRQENLDMEYLTGLALGQAFPDESKQQKERLEAAKSLLQIGMQSSGTHANTCLYLSMDMLECLKREDLKMQTQTSQLLSQARLRLGQIAAAEGNLDRAAKLFQQVLASSDTGIISPITLALTWYDAAIVSCCRGRILQAMVELHEANVILLRQQDDLQGDLTRRDEMALYYVEQATLRLLGIAARQQDEVQTQLPQPFPWSSDFSLLTRNEGGVIHGVPHNLTIPSSRTAAAGAA
jgi:tetratricopeptide (TPR) repeat protein